MLIMLFSILMIVIFSRLAVFGFRVSFGLISGIISLIVLPIVLIILVVAGLIRIALPVLLIIGIVTLFKERKENRL